MEFVFETGEKIICHDEAIAKILRQDKRYKPVEKTTEKKTKETKNKKNNAKKNKPVEKTTEKDGEENAKVQE